MFAPSSDDVRGFFVEAARKRAEGLPLTPLETMAADWIGAHPEYAPDLADAELARAAVYAPEAGRENPFLHLSMHLSISEQVSIDQPRGIRQACELLAARLGAARGDGMPRPHALGIAAQRRAARRRGVHRLRAATRDARLAEISDQVRWSDPAAPRPETSHRSSLWMPSSFITCFS